MRSVNLTDTLNQTNRNTTMNTTTKTPPIDKLRVLTICNRIAKLGAADRALIVQSLQAVPAYLLDYRGLKAFNDYGYVLNCRPHRCDATSTQLGTLFSFLPMGSLADRPSDEVEICCRLLREE